MTTTNIITTIDTLDYSKVDPGIRDTVRWFRSEGYQTTYSNDGSKLTDYGDEQGCTEPTVMMRVSRSELADACDDIAHALTERGIQLSAANTNGVWIEGSYDPAQPDIEGLILVIGLTDAILAAHPEPEFITRRLKLRATAQDDTI